MAPGGDKVLCTVRHIDCCAASYRNINAYGKLIWSEESAAGLIEIKNGATLNQTSGSWGIHVNTGYRLMIMGGSINCKGTAIVMDSESGYSKISGGTITSGDNDRTIQKNNGAITITGGTIANTNGGAAIKTSSTSILQFTTR